MRLLSSISLLPTLLASSEHSDLETTGHSLLTTDDWHSNTRVTTDIRITVRIGKEVQSILDDYGFDFLSRKSSVDCSLDDDGDFLVHCNTFPEMSAEAGYEGTKFLMDFLLKTAEVPDSKINSVIASFLKNAEAQEYFESNAINIFLISHYLEIFGSAKERFYDLLVGFLIKNRDNRRKGLSGNAAAQRADDYDNIANLVCRVLELYGDYPGTFDSCTELIGRYYKIHEFDGSNLVCDLNHFDEYYFRVFKRFRIESIEITGLQNLGRVQELIDAYDPDNRNTVKPSMLSRSYSIFRKATSVIPFVPVQVGECPAFVSFINNFDYGVTYLKIKMDRNDSRHAVLPFFENLHVEKYCVEYYLSGDDKESLKSILHQIHLSTRELRKLKLDLKYDDSVYKASANTELFEELTDSISNIFSMALNCTSLNTLILKGIAYNETLLKELSNVLNEHKYRLNTLKLLDLSAFNTGLINDIELSVTGQRGFMKLFRMLRQCVALEDLKITQKFTFDDHTLSILVDSITELPLIALTLEGALAGSEDSYNHICRLLEIRTIRSITLRNNKRILLETKLLNIILPRLKLLDLSSNEIEIVEGKASARSQSPVAYDYTDNDSTSSFSYEDTHEKHIVVAAPKLVTVDLSNCTISNEYSHYCIKTLLMNAINLEDLNLENINSRSGTSDNIIEDISDDNQLRYLNVCDAKTNGLPIRAAVLVSKLNGSSRLKSIECGYRNQKLDYNKQEYSAIKRACQDAVLVQARTPHPLTSIEGIKDLAANYLFSGDSSDGENGNAMSAFSPANLMRIPGSTYRYFFPEKRLCAEVQEDTLNRDETPKMSLYYRVRNAPWSVYNRLFPVSSPATETQAADMTENQDDSIAPATTEQPGLFKRMWARIFFKGPTPPNATEQQSSPYDSTEATEQPALPNEHAEDLGNQSEGSTRGDN